MIITLVAALALSVSKDISRADTYIEHGLLDEAKKILIEIEHAPTATSFERIQSLERLRDIALAEGNGDLAAKISTQIKELSATTAAENALDKEEDDLAPSTIRMISAGSHPRFLAYHDPASARDSRHHVRLSFRADKGRCKGPVDNKLFGVDGFFNVSDIQQGPGSLLTFKVTGDMSFELEGKSDLSPIRTTYIVTPYGRPAEVGNNNSDQSAPISVPEWPRVPIGAGATWEMIGPSPWLSSGQLTYVVSVTEATESRISILAKANGEIEFDDDGRKSTVPMLIHEEMTWRKGYLFPEIRMIRVSGEIRRNGISGILPGGKHCILFAYDTKLLE